MAEVQFFARVVRFSCTSAVKRRDRREQTSRIGPGSDRDGGSVRASTSPTVDLTLTPRSRTLLQLGLPPLKLLPLGAAGPDAVTPRAAAR